MIDDPLQVLGDLGMTGVFYSTSTLSEPWGVDLPPMPRMLIFHLLTEGTALLDVGGHEHWMREGDLVLVPHGTGHRIMSGPDAPTPNLWDIPRLEETDRYDRMEVLGGGAPAALVCGAVAFTEPAMARVLAGLPAVLPAGQSTQAGWLRSCIDVIARESREPSHGSDVVTSRLADVLLVNAVREWLAADTPGSGWLAAVRDPHLGAALRAFHADPGRPWTLAALAAEAHLSRSGFAARFRELVGEPPMTYVASWRMDLAGRRLRDPDTTIALVAREVGYESEPAFNRAFRRHHGRTPGAWRRDGSTLDLQLASTG
ncbi:MAG TPA: cupin domain-containing protein [Nocardioides sp.]|nr:cupin domain-containing protein [Nocardioides sp.]